MWCLRFDTCTCSLWERQREPDIDLGVHRVNWRKDLKVRQCRQSALPGERDTFWFGTVGHFNGSIETATDVSVQDIGRDFAFTRATWIGWAWIYRWEYLWLHIRENIDVDLQRALTRISTFKHGIDSIWTLAVVGDLRLTGRDAFPQRTTRRWLTGVYDDQRAMVKVVFDVLSLACSYTYSSALCREFRSIRANSDRETRFLDPCTCHYSHMDTMHTHLVLIKTNVQLRLFFCRSATLFACRTGKPEIALTSKWTRCTRNTSAVLIAYIRRADYIRRFTKRSTTY